jgi:16S rRNA (uracil1498-N3)-methyltransferase
MPYLHPRIYLDNLPSDGEITITGDKYRHLARSVRARCGDEIHLFNGRGLFADAVIDSIDSSTIHATITASKNIDNTPNVKLTLAFGILPAEPMKTLIAGATQLGVSAFMPFISRFNDMRKKPEQIKKTMERWQKLIIENSAVAARSHLPDIHSPIPLADVIKNAEDFEFKFAFWEEDGESWRDYLPLKKGKTIAVIGPKGGLHEDEVSMLRDSGLKILTMGDLILKAEMASIAVCARIIGG